MLFIKDNLYGYCLFPRNISTCCNNTLYICKFEIMKHERTDYLITLSQIYSHQHLKPISLTQHVYLAELTGT